MLPSFGDSSHLEGRGRFRRAWNRVSFFLFLFLTESFILTEVSFHVDRMAPSFDDDDEVFEEFRNETNPFLMEGRFRV